MRPVEAGSLTWRAVSQRRIQSCLKGELRCSGGCRLHDDAERGPSATAQGEKQVRVLARGDSAVLSIRSDNPELKLKSRRQSSSRNRSGGEVTARSTPRPSVFESDECPPPAIHPPLAPTVSLEPPTIVIPCASANSYRDSCVERQGSAIPNWMVWRSRLRSSGRRPL